MKLELKNNEIKLICGLLFKIGYEGLINKISNQIAKSQNKKEKKLKFGEDELYYIGIALNELSVNGYTKVQKDKIAALDFKIINFLLKEDRV